MPSCEYAVIKPTTKIAISVKANSTIAACTLGFSDKNQLLNVITPPIP